MFRPALYFDMLMEENVITIRNLTKKFGNFTAVDNISFDVRKGEIFGFLGANGAGKTTAMRILCGLSRPTSGEGTVAGYDINTGQEKIKRHIGYMSQKFSLYPDLTVRENIRLFGVELIQRRLPVRCNQWHVAFLFSVFRQNGGDLLIIIYN